MIDASTMLGALMKSYPGIVGFISALSSLLGLIFTATSLLMIARLNKHSGTPGGLSPMSVAMMFFAGIALWNFSSSIDTLLETLFGSGTSMKSLMSYSGPASASEQARQMWKGVIGAFSILGYITIMRGWMIARKIGSGQAAPDAAKGAMTRLFAGTGLVNIVGFINVITYTFGFGKLL